ncbi:tyrosine-type recombinase/integrase [Legionella sp. CNM-1927-20]|uniref:tyrosine-type recombinase/integrase n=1 Tax=Legionella sp. CNM-1927-20 TaxID=3422221 RepID=UPI00403B03B2
MAKACKAKVLKDAEFRRLLAVAKDSTFAIRNVAMIYCSFGLGFRAKEIASLTIADVADSHYRLLDEICLKRSMTKGEKQRYVYLSNKKLREALQAYLNHLKANHMARYKPFFQTQRRSRFTPNTLQKWFRKLYDKAGILGASRRTFITKLIEQEVDIKAASRLAGHASIVTTSIYVGDSPDRLKRIVANLALL